MSPSKTREPSSVDAAAGAGLIGPADAARRFERTERLLGKEAVARLAGARVLVAGLGAVGSYAVEGLARSGIGALRIVDFDVVQESNVNRQLYALTSTLGRPKVDVARERVLDIHPACRVEAVRAFVDAQTAPALLAGGFDAVIDAIDSLGPKVSFLAAAVRAGLFVVSSMGAATRTDPLAIRVGDVSETERCPLARWIRKRLRKAGIERGVRCVYSIEPARGAASDGAGVRTEADDAAFYEVHPRGRRRAPLGSLSCLTGIFGLVAAREVIAHIARARDLAPAGDRDAPT
jgi:tRNA A37 threonylcarbamoyladenosine dehydratase